MIRITDRQLIMSNSERYIGFEGDHNAKVLEFLVEDTSLAQLHFKIDIEEPECTVTPEKIMLENKSAKLIWTVGNGVTAKSGSIKIQLRAFDSDGNILWHSQRTELFIGPSIHSDKEYTDLEMSDFEQIQQSVTVMHDKAKQYAQSANSSKVSAQEYANTALSAAESAQQSANGAQSSLQVANTANKTANTALNVANTAQNTANGAMNLLEKKADAGHTHNLVSQALSGFMSASDKQKLDKYPVNPDELSSAGCDYAVEDITARKLLYSEDIYKPAVASLFPVYQFTSRQPSAFNTRFTANNSYGFYLYFKPEDNYVQYDKWYVLTVHIKNYLDTWSCDLRDLYRTASAELPGGLHMKLQNVAPGEYYIHFPIYTRSLHGNATVKQFGFFGEKGNYDFEILDAQIYSCNEIMGAQTLAGMDFDSLYCFDNAIDIVYCDIPGHYQIQDSHTTKAPENEKYRIYYDKTVGKAFMVRFYDNEFTAKVRIFDGFNTDVKTLKQAIGKKKISAFNTQGGSFTLKKNSMYIFRGSSVGLYNGDGTVVTQSDGTAIEKMSFGLFVYPSNSNTCFLFGVQGDGSLSGMITGSTKTLNRNIEVTADNKVYIKDVSTSAIVWEIAFQEE